MKRTGDDGRGLTEGEGGQKGGEEKEGQLKRDETTLKIKGEKMG